MKKQIVLWALTGLALTFSAQAQTSSSPTVEELQKQIQLLLSQMSSLQKEITTLKSAVPSTSVAPPTTPTPVTLPPSLYSPLEIDESDVGETETFFVSPPNLTRSLFRGSRGEDVRQLQEFLAQDSTIYPEGLATGYYGAGTEAAVKKWQAKNGVPAVGIVGRQTIAKFKELYKDKVSPKLITDPAPICAVYSPSTCPAGEERYLISDPASYSSCPIYACRPKSDKDKKVEICPSLPTVDSCPAGEERIVTYKSEQCGVYYTCKPRANNRADNTVATLKKISSIQTDNRYSINLYDPEGVQKFVVHNSKGVEINLGYPACRKEWSSPVISAESSEFPLKLTLSDCASSQFSTTLSTSVLVKQITEGLLFPYKFSNGKSVYSSDEARSYCYANGPASSEGVAGECETKFGVVYTNINTTTTSATRAIYSTDTFSACMAKYGFLAEAKQIKTWAQSSEAIPWSVLTNAAQNSVPVCEREYYGQQTIETGATMCADGKDNDGDGYTDLADPSCAYTTTTTTTTTAPAGQKEQTWNSLGLKSWIRTDAESARVDQLKSACTSVPSGSNIWASNAGLSTSADFGMPDAAKCSRASACTSGQYFDGANCVANTQTTTGATQCSDGRDNDNDGQIDYPADTGCYGSADYDETPGTNTSTSSCDSALTALLGTSCHYMYNDSAGNQTYCDGPMTKSAKRGDTATTVGCSSSTTSTSWPTDQTSCTSSGYKWCTSSSSSGWCQSNACPAGDYSYYPGDANSCPSFAYSRYDQQNRRYCQLNAETKCDYNYPSYLTNGSNYTAANCPTYTSGPALGVCSSLGSDWTVYGNYCLNNSRTQYAPTGSSLSSVQACTGADAPVTGCTPPSGSTTTTTTTSTSSCSQYGEGWHVMGDNNCYNSSMTEYRTANGTLYSCSSTPSSGCSSSSSSYIGSAACTSGQYWNGTSCVTSTTTACTSGQYWNGTACVATSPSDTTSTCPSGQYWSGSACVSSTPSASVYDQMKNQLKFMEIILRGLLGR